LIKKIQIIIISILFTLCLFAVNASTAKSATDSATQQLTLTILPAIETHLVQVGEPIIQEQTLVQQFAVYARANTTWSFSVSPVYDAGRANLPICNHQEQILPSNSDDSFQIYYFSCWQKLSWADTSTNGIFVNLNVWQNF